MQRILFTFGHRGKHVWVERIHSLAVSRSTRLEGYNALDADVDIRYSTVGRATFISAGSSLPYCRVGRFCSIGRNVRVVAGVHPTSVFASTSPVFFSSARQTGVTFTPTSLSDDTVYVEPGVYCKIGNDVWIGDNACIMSGVSIGDGAVIGANALVRHDVEPYSIVAGVEATEIRKRFTPEERNYLLKLRWWDMDMQFLDDHAQDFTDIRRLMQALP
jgi:acetyltransferase-like isoleucine patch superfamily enzyme